MNLVHMAQGLACAAAIAGAAAAEVRPIGSRLELFVDRYLIDRMDGVELRLAHPADTGPVLRFDLPWEGPFSGYITMIRDGERFRAYYRGKPTPGRDGAADEVTCVAESADGVRWTKPALGIVEVGGSRRNNVILDKSYPTVSHNFTPFLDTRPGVPAAERYKALGGLFEMENHPSSGGLLAFVSGDGLRWRKLRDQPVLTRRHYNVRYTDTSSTPAFWSEAESCYVAYLRTWMDDGRNKRAGWGGNIRWVGRATSPDFVNWSAVEMMTFGDAPMEQLYSNTTGPYFRAPHIYVALTPRIVFGRPAVTPEEAAAVGIDARYARDQSEPVLITSRGGARYDRTFLEAFIRPGIGPENWTSRNNYPALNVVPTGVHEMSIYVQSRYGQRDCALRRYVLPPDRFASVNAPFRGGEFTTHPLVFEGRALLLNFSSSVVGGIRVEIRDAEAKPIEGYTLADAVETVGNALERPVAWKKGPDVSPLAGKPVRLRFVMKEADLYALRFR